MSVFGLVESFGHEEVVILQDPVSGLRGVLAIHDTSLGPAAGGTRLGRYASLEEAAGEALVLARAATRAMAACGLNRGGGQAVLIGEPSGKSRPLLSAYAKVLDRLDGRFTTGPDLGFDSRDLAVMSRMTRHVLHRKGMGAMDASDLTALGVVESIRAAAEALGRTLEGLHVAIQGLGGVGMRLARLLAAEQARLTVADRDPGQAERAEVELGATVVAPDALCDVEADVFSPNAVGGVLDEATIRRLRCRAVVGATTGVLADDRHAETLHERGILYAPDFLVGGGGAVGFLGGPADDDEMVIQGRVSVLAVDIGRLLARSLADGTPPYRSAEASATARVARAREARGRPAPRGEEG